MNAARLADTLDAADPLFEAKRRPGQLEVDHQTATLLKVEPFAGGIGGEQQPSGAAGETAQVLATLGCGESAVQRHRRQVCQSTRPAASSVSRYSVKTIAGSCARRRRRVSARSFDSAGLRASCEEQNALEPSTFFVAIVQAGRRQLCCQVLRRQTTRTAAASAATSQVTRRSRGGASRRLDRAGQRPCTAAGAAGQHHHGEVRRIARPGRARLRTLRA